ncbi:MAG: hypothetical protein LUQ29_00530, partial [Methylococcaceae bacterium]|nr:hypothetical protein [Methylococcaceae bacterium]
KPLSELNHLTVPVVIVDMMSPLINIKYKAFKAGKAGKFRNYLMKQGRATTRRNIEKVNRG